jgi:zinc/manganese transport system permease protein
MTASMLVAVASVWGGLAAAYAAPRMPPSFAIIAVATVSYAIVFARSRLTRAVQAAA